MKRTRVFVIASIALLLAAVQGLGAEALDKTVATIRLAKTTETIFLSQLKKQIDATETALNKGQALSTEQRKSILNDMILKILISQAAERDKVKPTAEQSKAYLDSYRALILRQAGATSDIPEADWKNLVRNNTGMSYEEWQKQFEKTVVIPQVYVLAKRGQEIGSVVSPTDPEVQEIYDANKSQYLRHDMAMISHIFVDTTGLTSKDDRDKALKRAEDIARELRAGAAFKDLVLKYSDDSANKYKDGKVGWVDRENLQYKQALGPEIFAAIFRMSPGDVSGVLASPKGYHIIRVDERLDARILGLDDPIMPDNRTTVREYIRSQLLSQKQQLALANAMKDVGDTLRKEAEEAEGIRIFQENLPW